MDDIKCVFNHCNIIATRVVCGPSPRLLSLNIAISGGDLREFELSFRSSCMAINHDDLRESTKGDCCAVIAGLLLVEHSFGTSHCRRDSSQHRAIIKQIEGLY